MQRWMWYVAAFAVFLVVVSLSLSWVGQESAKSEPCNEHAPRLLFVKKRIPVCVFVAYTPEARRQGLSGRASIESGEGLLFVFPVEGIYTFWMKDMLFSIDILWLATDGTVVYMAQDVSPDTFPSHFVSESPALYVLELPAGYTKAHGVQVGDIVRL